MYIDMYVYVYILRLGVFGFVPVSLGFSTPSVVFASQTLSEPVGAVTIGRSESTSLLAKCK